MQTETREKIMNSVFKAAFAPATALIATIAFGMIATEASAGEFCRRDVTGHMTSCGFSNMAQCQATSAGIGGECFRDPYLNEASSAYASSKPSRAGHGSPAAGRHGTSQ